MRNHKIFPHLFRYLEEMRTLTLFIENVKCIGCGWLYSYKKFENIEYGFKEDSFFCIDCYYKYLEDIVNYAKELGDKPYFHGDMSIIESKEKEILKFNKIKPRAALAQHTTYPNLVEWVKRMELMTKQTILAKDAKEKKLVEIKK